MTLYFGERRAARVPPSEPPRVYRRLFHFESVVSQRFSEESELILLRIGV